MQNVFFFTIFLAKYKKIIYLCTNVIINDYYSSKYETCNEP